MSAGKFVHVSVQMLGAHVMKSALIASFEQRPKGFDPIGMRLPVYILPNAVVQGGMVRHSIIYGAFVGIELGLFIYKFSYKLLYIFCIGRSHYFCSYFIGRSIFDPCHGNFSHRSMSSA